MAEYYKHKDILEDGDIAYVIKNKEECLTMMFSEDLGWQTSIIPESDVFFEELIVCNSEEALKAFENFDNKAKSIINSTGL